MRDKFKDFVNTLATIKVDEVGILIRITCPSNVHPLIPHFYIAKLGYAGAYLFFLIFLLQNIDCGYSLEPPHRSMF